MISKPIRGKSAEEISLALQQSLSDGFKPTLAIVFISIKLERNLIYKLFSDEEIDLIGSTSCGLFSNDYQDGYEGDGSAVILLLDIPRDAYRILYEDIGEKPINEVASILAGVAYQEFTNPAMILCSSGISTDGDMFPGEELIRNLINAAGQQIKIIGGMAGDDITFTGSYIFHGNNETDFGAAVLVLDEDKIELQSMAVSGWKPIGIERTATKCNNGWLYTIDDQPALDMYLKYLGRGNVIGDNKHEIFTDTSVHFPFQVDGVGDPMMRTPFQIDKENGAIKLDFEIPQGTKFRFSMPPDFDIVDNVLSKAEELKNKGFSEAEALLIFSCAGRLTSLGPMTTQENEGLSRLLNAPMVGFFTYGEYGTTGNDEHSFHSTTISWVALKEK